MNAETGIDLVDDGGVRVVGAPLTLDHLDLFVRACRLRMIPLKTPVKVLEGDWSVAANGNDRHPDVLSVASRDADG